MPECASQYMVQEQWSLCACSAYKYVCMCYSHEINHINDPTQHKFEQEVGGDLSVCVLNLEFV